MTPSAPRDDFVCGGDGGRARATWLGILGHAFPSAPGKISLDLNYDALAPIGDPEEVEVSGAERTTFYPTMEARGENAGIGDSAGCTSRSGVLLPVGSLHLCIAVKSIPGEVFIGRIDVAGVPGNPFLCLQLHHVLNFNPSPMKTTESPTPAS